MALSRVIAIGDGVTTQFAVSFALDYLSEDDIQCRVADEVDGSLNPVYRDIVFINPGLIEVGGTVPADGDRVEFTRTIEDEALLVDWEDGAVINDDNLNLSQKQMLMLIHQLLDGRFNVFANDINMGGFKVTNLGDPTEDGDAVNLAYVVDNALSAAEDAAAADASADAAAASASAASASQVAASDSAVAATTAKNAAELAETNAEAAAASADADATTASDAATTATTQAGLAATSKIAAELAETNAEAAEVNAEAAEVAAEAAQAAAEDARFDAITAKDLAEAALALTLSTYDNFDDRYLGAKSANPTLDNDGNALVGGALYFNDVVGEIRVWTGSVWVAAYVSGSGFLATSGGTMTGDIVLAGDPTSDLHAAPKQYVDLRLLKSGDTMTGPLILDAADGTDTSLRIPHGTAPASPTNGDVWTTSADLLVRITGVTYKMVNVEGAQSITGAKTFNALLTTLASASGGAGLNLPHGAAPSAPVDGDVWTTSAGGLFGRVNGTTLNFQSKFTTLSGYGISDTKANFNTAVSDGNIAFIGDTLAASLTGGNWKVFYTDGSGVITELALGAAATVLTSNGESSAPSFTTPTALTLAAAQATTSGTTIDFTGIPAGVKAIDIILNGVAKTTNSQQDITIGDAGGLEATGYVGAVAIIATTVSVVEVTTSIRINDANDQSSLSGIVRLRRVNATHTWVYDGILYSTKNAGLIYPVAGTKTLSAELTQLRIASNTAYTAGSITIQYQ